jgi:hypothetical protein
VHGRIKKLKAESSKLKANWAQRLRLKGPRCTVHGRISIMLELLLKTPALQFYI